MKRASDIDVQADRTQHELLGLLDQIESLLSEVREKVVDPDRVETLISEVRDEIVNGG